MPRLDVAQLGGTIQELFVAGLAKSIQRTYRSGEKRYTDFCTVAALAPFPASEPTLMAFVAFLYREGLSGSSVKLYLAAIRHAQIAMSMGDPHITSMPKLEYVTKGMHKITSARKLQRQLPITPSVMRKLKDAWEQLPCQEDAAMLWAAACLCFFGFLRMGEAVVPSDSAYDPAVHLNWEDVQVNSRSQPQWLEVRTKASKTDPCRQDISIYVGATGR